LFTCQEELLLARTTFQVTPKMEYNWFGIVVAPKVQHHHDRWFYEQFNISKKEVSFVLSQNS
jgi:hypothetical protein